ncbi:MAG: rhodanese-like domain-containing protein [Myxococcales bacterium]
MSELASALKRALRDATLVAAGCAAVGFAVNALRPSGSIPFVARQPYALVVPCPVLGGEATGLAPNDPKIGQDGVVIVDARSKAEFEAWHLPRARSVPFDYLESVSKAHVDALLASGASSLVVYGDGQDPDSGQELAKELAGKGLRNVFFVQGGAPALGAGARP